MTRHPLPSPLPRFDRRLLSAVELLVPPPDREDWSRTWQSELWHIHHQGRNQRGRRLTIDLSVGLLRDALWLRVESWRRSFSGTATLCLASLLALVLLSALFALALTGSAHDLALSYGASFRRFLYEAPLVVLVTFATLSRRHVAPSSTSRTFFWIKRQLFFAAKSVLLLLLSFLLSANLAEPIHTLLPLTAFLLQPVLFVLCALLCLRWSFRDQETRCKQCLRSLATPARVGRPSHNLLEWNGTELLCKQGHGSLSVPEMETSWCEFSQWVDHSPIWDEPASI